MTDQDQRLEIATVKAENGSEILSRFSNDAVSAPPIPTDSGYIPNLKQVIASVNSATNAAADLVAILDAAEDNRQTQFNTFMDASGFEPSIAYGTGILLDRTTKTVCYLGDEYRARGAFIPFTTSDWETDAVRLKLIGDDSLRQTLAAATGPTQGAAQVGWDGETVSVQMDLSKKLSDYAALRAYTGTAVGFKITDANFSGEFVLDPFDEVSTDDKSTVIVGATGRRYKRLYAGRMQAAWCEGANDSLIIQAAIDAAVRAGKSEVGIDREYICDTALKNRTNIRFIGSGALLGNASYRVRVIPEWAPVGREPFQDLIPAQHLRAFSAAPAPTVVIIGSSTGTWSADSIDTGSGVTALLQRLLNKYNPDKAISFYNRCIGSQTFATLDGKPTSFPAWYTDTSRNWLDYISDLAPDSVYILLGSNDSSAATRSRIKSIIDKLAAFAKAPDVVFFTQPSVCPDPDPALASSGSRAGQEGRDYAAGLVRSMAQYYKKGLIDANRMGGIVLDGRDILDNVSMRILPAPPVTSGRFAPALATIDFSMSLTFNGTAAASDAAFLTTATNPVFVKTGAGGANSDSGDIAYIQKNADGFLRVQLYSDGLYQTLTTKVVFPTASFTLDVIKVGNVMTLSFNGSEDVARVSFNIIAAGGEMYPRTGYYNVTSGPWASVIFNVGLPKLYKKLLTSQEAWGLPNPAAARQMPYGGNGVNHFSGLGTREIYGRVMDTPALRGVTSDFGEYSPPIRPLLGTPEITLPASWAWTRTGNIVTVHGSASISSAAPGGSCSFSAPVPIVPVVLNQLKTTGIITGTKAGMTGAGYGDPDHKEIQFVLVGATSTASVFRLTFSYRLS